MLEKYWLLGFPEMYNIIPEGRSGNFVIRHNSLTKEQARQRELNAIFNFDPFNRRQHEGTYCVLMDGTNGDESVWMSDTYMERSSNLDIKQCANGDVLIAGLGIGLILTVIAKESNVKSITVIELEQDVINLVEQPLRDYLGDDSNKLNIIKANINDWKPTKKYDTIYFDIWRNISVDNWNEMKSLHKKFKNVLNRTNENCWMSSWQRGYIKREIAREKAEERRNAWMKNLFKPREDLVKAFDAIK